MKRWDLTELRRAAIIASLITVIGASWSAASAADRPVSVSSSATVASATIAPLQPHHNPMTMAACASVSDRQQVCWSVEEQGP